MTSSRCRLDFIIRLISIYYIVLKTVSGREKSKNKKKWASKEYCHICPSASQFVGHLHGAHKADRFWIIQGGTHEYDYQSLWGSYWEGCPRVPGQAGKVACCSVLVSVSPVVGSLCDPVDRSPPGFFVHGILQAGILEWVIISDTKYSIANEIQNQNLPRLSPY